MGMNILNKVLKCMDNKLSVTRETNKMVYLSDGSSYNKKEFNKFRSVMHCYMYQQRDLECQSIMRDIIDNKNIEYVQDAYSTQLIEALHAELRNSSTPKVQEKPKVINEARFSQPIGMNKRFICGYIYDNEDNPEFIMLFWNNYSEVGNGHGDLEEYYRKHFNNNFEAVSGGFFINHSHNNSEYDVNSVYLFGQSTTYRSFYIEKDEIIKYGKKHNINFIFGKTQFEIGERSNIITENFKDEF
jgi:hypothetical protein